MATYTVWRAEYKLLLPDPLMPPTPIPRTHNAIFVQTDSQGNGRTIQVDGSLADTNGMSFQEKRGERFEETYTFLRKHYLGQIRATDYAAVVELMRSLPPPPRQRAYDHSIGGQGPCKPDGSRYGPGEVVPEYWKCTEWTLQHAIPALQKSGYLFPDGVAQTETLSSQQQTSA